MEDGHVIREIELELPDPGLHVAVDHDEANVVGEVAYCELDPDQRLNIVSVIDGAWIANVDQPVFYSGRFDCRGARADLSGGIWSARRAFLVGLSVTLHPASLEARPLRFMPGDMRDRATAPTGRPPGATTAA